MISELRNKLTLKQGQREQVKKSIHAVKVNLKLQKKQQKQYEQAREIIREVGLKTQQQLQFHISNITSLALEAVFTDPYELLIEFVQRRNKTECDISFQREGNKIDPLTASGGGAVDVAAFALRLALWSMQTPKSNNVIILDEPLRFLSVAYQEKASQMIKELSEKLNLQFIIITHQPELCIYADKIFEVTQTDGVSKVSTKN